jgi:exodeoxyribonuclease VII large subunit
MLALARQRFDTAAGSLAQALRANTQQHRTQFIEITARLSSRPLNIRARTLGGALRVANLRSSRAITRNMAMHQQRLASSAKLFASLSYKSVLQRGFALVRSESGETVRSAAAVKPAQALIVEFADGGIAVRAEGRPIAKRKTREFGQGSLF